MIRQLVRRIVGEPIITANPYGWPTYTWNYPRLRHVEIWLFGGSYLPRGPYYEGALLGRIWRWLGSQVDQLHRRCTFAYSYRIDLYVAAARFWRDLRGEPYHFCDGCRAGVCLNGIRDALRQRSESERKARLAQSSASNDLIRLQEVLRLRTEAILRGHA